MNLATVMDQVAARLRTIATLAGRTSEYPPDSVNPPAAIVSYPDEYMYDETFGRGMDRLMLPVVVVVGKVSDRSARNQLGAYVDGSGGSSVKQILESGSYTAFQTLRVADVNFDTVTIAGTNYIAALFILDITGKGA